MAMMVVKGGSPKFVRGALDPGGGSEFTRVQALDAYLKQTREMTGTQPHTLVVEIVRDSTQGTAADLLAHKTKYGAKGRAQKSVFPLSILIIDDIRNEDPALVGTIQCLKTVIHKIKVMPGVQVITFHASEWKYANALTPQNDITDVHLIPVTTRGFDDTQDAASAAVASKK